MKKIVSLLLALLCLGGFALGEAELSYDGSVVAGKTVPVSVPYGGRVTEVSVTAGSWVREGDTLGALGSTLNFAPIEGTVTGLNAVEGDSAETAAERYGAVLWLEPTHRYTLEATDEKAWNNSENHYLHLGERVYLSCATDGTHTGTGFVSAFTESGFSIEVTGGEFYLDEKVDLYCVSDGTHKGTGIVTALTDSGYDIEVTGGEFYLSEKVDVYRTEDLAKEGRLGRGTVKRAKPVAVKGSGSILKRHAETGDFVERGELLFETVEGVLDGLYAPEGRILCPETGIVTSVEKAQGDTIGKGETLVKIAPASSFQVQFDIPEPDLFILQAGTPVTMELYWDNADAKTYSGTISSISFVNEEQKADSGTGSSGKKTYRAYATLAPDERIRLGMTMIVYPGAAPAAAEETDQPTETERAEENEHE